MTVIITKPYIIVNIPFGKNDIKKYSGIPIIKLMNTGRIESYKHHL